MAAEVFDDLVCSLGEGPLWHPERGSLIWFDIDNKVMFERAEGGARSEYRFDRTVTAAGLMADPGKLFVASERDLFVYDLESGAEEVVSALDAENPLTRSNDGRADPWGGFWIGTMGYKLEHEMGAIYRYYRGELRLLYPDITVSNAICFAPDRSVAYCTDSRADKVIWRVPLDDEGWPAAPREDFVRIGAEATFGPDGAVVDASGQVWNAQFNKARVAVYGTDGAMVAEHGLPTSLTTCPAFGGPDLTTLYVTTAGGHLPPEKQGKEPKAGMTFRISGAGQGREEYRVVI